MTKLDSTHDLPNLLVVSGKGSYSGGCYGQLIEEHD